MYDALQSYGWLTFLPCDAIPLKKKSSKKPLPSDVAELQRLVQQQQEQIDHLLRMLFGRRSEKFDPDTSQSMLFDPGLGEDAEESDRGDAEDEDVPQRPPRRRRRRRKHPGRTALPSHLRRCVHVIDPPDEELTCPCCQSRKEAFGEEITEELEMQPIQVYVNRYVRPKYACSKCKGYVSTAAAPARAMNKGIPGIALLAHLIVSKYADALPLYRQQQIFRRWGLELACSTLGNWVAYAAEVLRPITLDMRIRLVASRRIYTDDTPIRVLGPARQSKLGRMWVYISDDDEVTFDYTPHRKRSGPVRVLRGFRGYLQADAFSGYDVIYDGGNVVEVACWAHARRMFFDAQDASRQHARRMLELIGRLYAVESRARAIRDKLEDEGRFDLQQWEELLLKWRQRYSRRRLSRIRAELDRLVTFARPKSMLGKAVIYAGNQWKALNHYTEAAFLDIDNNHSERQIKQFVIGRKNFLFCGSDQGAENAAVLYSLIVTCKLHDVDPEAYLRDVLDRVQNHPEDRMWELSPVNWKHRFGSGQASSSAATPAA